MSQNEWTKPCFFIHNTFKLSHSFSSNFGIEEKIKKWFEIFFVFVSCFSEMISRIIGVVLIDGLIDESFHGPTYFFRPRNEALFGLFGLFLFSVFRLHIYSLVGEPFLSVNSSIKTFFSFLYLSDGVKDLFKHSENNFSLQIVLWNQSVVSDKITEGFQWQSLSVSRRNVMSK